MSSEFLGKPLEHRRMLHTVGMRIVLIVNPSSGGADDEVFDSIRNRLAAGGEVSVLEPGRESFESDVRDAAQDAGLVAVAGGDGTFSKALNALGDRLDEIVLAVLPTGTGNDLARSLGLPLDPVEAARVAVGGVERRIDVGRVSGAGSAGPQDKSGAGSAGPQDKSGAGSAGPQDKSGAVVKLFVNACIGGFPVAMDGAVNPEAKSRVGPLAFWAAGAKVAADLPRTAVTMSGVEVPDCVAVGVGNGRTSGGGIAVWPDAVLDDGLLDGCALAAPTAPAAARLAATVKWGRHQGLHNVVVTKGPRILIDSEPAIEINVDGELIGLTTPATFELAGGARIMVDRKRAGNQRSRSS